MKFSKDTRPNGVTDSKSAQLLVEALPWIKNITGKTIVIKYGGAASTAVARISRKPWRKREYPSSSRTGSA